MKTTIFNRFSRCLAAALLLTAASCTDNIDCPKISGNEVTVSFTLSPEDLTPATRAGEDGENGADLRHKGISGGTYIDKLIYAVYDENFTLLEDYGDDSEDDAQEKRGTGQTVRKIDEFPCTVKITLKRDQTYHIAFWAQSSLTDAYNTTDLRKVEVNYKRLVDGSDSDSDSDDYSNGDYHARNNDEYRDAFCRSVEVKAGSITSDNNSIQKNVYLYRPLAQINVGTAGFDYELVTRGTSQKYTYSKIRINRVARYLDVAKDEIYASSTSEGDIYNGDETSESFAVVDFEYAPIPAYIFNGYNDPENPDNPENPNRPVVPKHPSYTRFDWEYHKYKEDSDKFYDQDKERNLPYNNDIYYDPKFYPYESFLQLRHPGYWNGNDPIEGTAPVDENEKSKYIGYANYYDYNDAPTETYKYLSMCYVLTNSTKEQATTIDNIKVWLATDDKGTDKIELFSIENVPVQRNWRTNIVGNLLTEEVSLNVSMDKNFAGEFNGKYTDTEDNGWEDISGLIADGVYYDAKADEILISNRNGLIWFQQMVNGEMKVREQFGGKEGFNSTNLYTYYIDSDKKEKSIPNEFVDPSKLPDDVVRNRIINATHIKDDVSNYNHNPDINMKWPAGYRFNFYGAKVKLMADIDLADIEWIPIGFDLAIHDNSCGPAKDDIKTKLDYNYATHTDGDRRMFCGTFDGNGHSIYNLKNVRFGAQVHDNALQNGSGKASPYDNVQWMPAGFFGLIGDGATIKNLKLVNVDIFGYNAAGAIAGIANSSSRNNNVTLSPVRIDSCSVEGGRIYLSPMYRGDNRGEPSPNWDDDLETSRSFARGIYAGGIVGQMSVAKGDKKSGITNCSVSGAFIHAYRRAGGILGSISNSEQAEWDNIDEKEIKITDNRLSDVTIITNKFQAYHRLFHDFQAKINLNVWKNGYGWNGSQAALGGIFVGGMEKETYLENNNNTQNGVVFSDFATKADVKAATPRSSEIGNISLDLMPMLSSWFTDTIALTSNFYGAPSAKIVVGHHAYRAWIQNIGSYSNVTIQVPMKLPTDLSIDYNTGSPNAGLYVESVRLDGKASIGGRSVITASDVAAEGACVMFVTARDREQFKTKLYDITKKLENKWSAAQPTILHNMVLRGSPYAWAGLLISPNANMSKVVVDNVHIYDVYQTVALNPESKLMDDTNLWPNRSIQNTSGVELDFQNSNWRGYTNPGDGWKSVSYTNMTFESGMNVNQNGDQADNYKTLKVGTTKTTATTFTDCIFKAPFVIDMTSASATFVTCYAAAAAVGNVLINLDLVKEGDCTKIEISSNSQGQPQVTYYVGDVKYDQDGNQIVEE